MTHEWAAEVGRVEVDPTDRLKRVPVPQPHPRPLSADEMDLVLRESTGTLNAWLQLAYLAGLRAHEIAKFRGEDIDRDRVTVVGKGRQHRVRATYGTSLLRNGANVRVVQDLMRHRSLASTEHYLAATEDEMVAAIRTLGRLAA